MTSGLQSQWLVQWLIHKTYWGDAILIFFRLIPYVSIWIATVFLYIFIPNTKVNFVSALLGGVLAGTSWQLAQWGYFHFQVGVANYNAIYGTLAALPVFMVWIYTSWLIILFGLEIVRVHQYRSHGAAGLLPSRSDRLSGEELAIALLIQVCQNFHDGLKPPTTSMLADSLGAQFSHVNDMLVILSRYGYLAVSAGGQSGWLPACEPSGMGVSDIVSALRGGDCATPLYSSPSRTVAEGVLRRSREAGRSALSDVSIHDLLSEGVMVAQQPEAG
jgi:membrane protein